MSPFLYMDKPRQVSHCRNLNLCLGRYSLSWSFPLLSPLFSDCLESGWRLQLNHHLRLSTPYSYYSFSPLTAGKHPWNNSSVFLSGMESLSLVSNYTAPSYYPGVPIKNNFSRNRKKSGNTSLIGVLLYPTHKLHLYDQLKFRCLYNMALSVLCRFPSSHDFFTIRCFSKDGLLHYYFLTHLDSSPMCLH